MPDAATDNDLGGWDARWLKEPWKTRFQAMQERIRQDRIKIQALEHHDGNIRGKASAYDEMTALLKPYLTENKNWLTTIATLIHRAGKQDPVLLIRNALVKAIKPLDPEVTIESYEDPEGEPVFKILVPNLGANGETMEALHEVAAQIEHDLDHPVQVILSYGKRS